MRTLFHTVDELLRGAFTRRESLNEGRVDVSNKTLVLASLVLGVLYGAFMGLYGSLRTVSPSAWQIFASAVKVPMLFMLTVVVAYPSLYVFSALARSKLRFYETLRLMLVALTVNLAVLASLGPVTAFFTLSTESYPFMVLLNVLFFTVSGVIGLRFLRAAMDIVFDAPQPTPEPAPEPTPTQPPVQGPPHPALRPAAPPARQVRTKVNTARTIFKVWMVIFAVVGAQMGWILRPFIGSPGAPFTLFRERESNFFLGVLEQIKNLFS